MHPPSLERCDDDHRNTSPQAPRSEVKRRRAIMLGKISELAEALCEAL
jgi:hypothetical protein